MRSRFAGILAAVAVLCWTSPAVASPSQESLFQDDDLLLHASPAEVDRTMAELKDLGVDRLRLSAIWRDLAPAPQATHRPALDLSDPRVYDQRILGYLDTAVRTAQRYGIGVLINARGPAPEWAQPHPMPERFAGRGAYMPDPNQFRLFVQMLGARYDGSYVAGGEPLPRVPSWSVWNEPNWSGHLQPQTIRDAKTHRLRTVAPVIYRRLLRAATNGLQATGHDRRKDVILIGETAPIGNAKLGELSHLRPLRFLRDLFCLDGALRPLTGERAREEGCDFDRRGPLLASSYAHHPYTVVAPPWQPTVDTEDVTLADLPRLYDVLDAAARAHRVPGHLPVWLTEFGYQTDPPDPYRGVSLSEQASWLVAAEHQTWQDRRVSSLTQFLLRDAAPAPLYDASDARYWGTYQTGLEFNDGSAKPAYEAYRLPLMAPEGLTPGKPLTLWGMVRPGEADALQHVQVEYQRDAGADWTVLQEFDVSGERGYFEASIPDAKAGQYRFQWLRPAPAPAAGRRKRSRRPTLRHRAPAGLVPSEALALG